MKKYNSYHTTIKQLVKRDSLPNSYSNIINRSTLWRWKKEPQSKYIRTELQNIEILENFISRKDSLAIMKTYIKFAITISLILSSTNDFYRLLKRNKDQIITSLIQFNNRVNLKLVLHILKIPRSVYYACRNSVLYKCTTSQIKLCKRIYPHQLTNKEVSVIKELVTSDRLKYWPICSIAWYAIRENLLHVAHATWYKYVHLLGLKKARIDKKIKQLKGINANAPNEIWHADITIVKSLDGLKNYVYLLMDNYSKYIINWRVEPVVSGSIRTETIKDGYQKHIFNLNDLQLIIDGGPENNNALMDDYINSPGISLRKLIAQKDIPFSNSLIEAQNKLLKYRYLFKCQYKDIGELRKALDWIIPDYNNQRPHNSLKGLTPYEAFTGKTFDHSDLQSKIKNAKQNRIIENKKDSCGICC